jgi:hypothetical protein
VAGRLGTFTYLIVTDPGGVSIAFYKPQDFKVIRQALHSQAANHHSWSAPSELTALTSSYCSSRGLCPGLNGSSFTRPLRSV